MLEGRLGPKPILAALVATRKGEIAQAALQNILWFSDPTKKIHEALGLGRTHWWVFFKPHVLLGYGKALFRGGVPTIPAKGEDLLQLGGDFLWDGQGNLIWAHRSKDPTDRPHLALIKGQLELLSLN